MSTSLDQYVKQHEAAQLEKLRAQVCLIGDILSFMLTLPQIAAKKAELVCLSFQFFFNLT